jgi:hypothetical protein
MTDMNEHKYDQQDSTDTPDESKKNPSQQPGTQHDPKRDPKNERDKDAENSRRQDRDRVQEPERRSA